MGRGTFVLPRLRCGLNRAARQLGGQSNAISRGMLLCLRDMRLFAVSFVHDEDKAVSDFMLHTIFQCFR
ncbi:hypothetical protein GGD55_005737 [Rhizobium giardinii]|jgi:hypothetical protein|uniref:Uncharacterized protein n=1 Tax=Rhizobium giardinii TaxID=56731 RepID=A0A7W8UGL7_9HYPH|nr:hypothetical protein [Rhizobium giardinii]